MTSRHITLLLLLLLLLVLTTVGGCYLSRAPDPDERCDFTYSDATASGPISCRVSSTADETCFDAALCICEGRAPEATVEEIEACAQSETVPRAMITLADFCGGMGPASLAEALTGWAEAMGVEVIIDSDACEDVPATLDWWQE
jgi:hypothetical protein